MRDPGLAGIGALLRCNRDYRRLWLAQVVSQAGDWVNYMAVTALLLELTGSGAMVGWSLILRMLPTALVTPLAGVFIDRWDRRRVLIATDVLRGLLVPCFLLAQDPGRVWLVYVLIVGQVSMSAFFEPARHAIIPSIVTREQLLSANALSAVTWSLMAAIGSALGGLLVFQLGFAAALWFDAGTFLLSAWLLVKLRAPERPAHPVRSVGQVVTDLIDGFRYVRKDPAIGSLVLIKSGVGVAGGMVLLLSVLGREMFPMLGAPDSALPVPGASDALADSLRMTASGVGILFAARALGTAIGPFLGRAISGYHQASMRRLIGPAFFQAGLFLIAFGCTHWVPAALVLLTLAHLGTSINWVFSSVLLQLRVRDELRGRVFSVEMFLFTVMFCLVTWLTGFALDQLHLDPRLLAAMCGGALLVPGTFWMLAQRRRDRRMARRERNEA